jgi:hypothetical protein
VAALEGGFGGGDGGGFGGGDGEGFGGGGLETDPPRSPGHRTPTESDPDTISLP